MFHRSWGIMLIQANIQAPCTLLDFPKLDRFIEELRDQQYDVIGITSIIPNEIKVKKMCELIRQYQPQAKIVIGGPHRQRARPGRRIDADHVVRGEGVAVVPPLPGRGGRAADAASGGRLGHRHAEHGHHGQRSAAATWPPR